MRMDDSNRGHIDPGDPPAEQDDNNQLRFALDMQQEMQETHYNYDFANMTEEDRVAFITWNVLALTDELHEALGEVGWKPWASSRHVNREAYTGELVDAFHFFMNLCIVVGMDADELFTKYMAKVAVNKRRQEQGYDGVTSKCPGCKRALDDATTMCYASRLADTWWCSQVKMFVDKEGVRA